MEGELGPGPGGRPPGPHGPSPLNCGGPGPNCGPGPMLGPGPDIELGGRKVAGPQLIAGTELPGPHIGGPGVLEPELPEGLQQPITGQY